MSSAGASSSTFLAIWEGRFGYYRLYESDTSKFLVALIYQFFNTADSPWIFEPVNCSDDFRPPVLFCSGPLAGQHSYPLDITVLTDTDDLPF